MFQKGVIYKKLNKTETNVLNIYISKIAIKADKFTV